MSRTLRDDVAAYFKARPNTWIDGMAIAQIGGCYASRTRISDCRTQLDMTIENRQRREGRRVISEYRFVPANLLELAEAS